MSQKIDAIPSSYNGHLDIFENCIKLGIIVNNNGYRVEKADEKYYILAIDK